MVKSIGIFSIAYLLLAASLHEYYVSVAQAKYNTESQSLEVGIKVFTDDLERALTQQLGAPVKLSDATQRRAIEDALSAYLETHFVVTQQNVLQEFNWVGLEPGADETWLYFEIFMPASGTFTMKNTVLFEAFPAQINIVHLEVGAHKQSHYFNSQKAALEITLP